MRVVLQRVSYASVSVEHKLIGNIDQGFLLLVGFTQTDTLDIVEKMAKKCCQLRVFEDDQGKMNKNIQEVSGSILSISQFTLYADCRKGRRPGFEQAANGSVAKPLYHAWNEALRQKKLNIKTGVFGADMKIELLNDGPVTIILDSKELRME